MNVDVVNVVLVGLGVLFSLIGYLELSRRASSKDLKQEINKLDEKVDGVRRELREDIAVLGGQLAVTNQNVYELNTRVSAALGLPAAEPAESATKPA